MVAVANSLIDKNRERMPKRLVAARLAHGPDRVASREESRADEAEWMRPGAPSRCTARAWRSATWPCSTAPTTSSRPVEEALLRAEVPHAVYSGVPFFGRREIKDALSYLRLVAYRDDLDFARVANVPKRNLGQAPHGISASSRPTSAGCSLYEALCARGWTTTLFKRTKARQLLDLIERFHSSYEGRPVSEVLVGRALAKAATSARCAPRAARSGSTTWPSSSSPSTSSKPRAVKR